MSLDVDRIQKYFIFIALLVVLQTWMWNMVTGEIKNPPRSLNFYSSAQVIEQQNYR
ncbi:hypothetical protein [Mangrovibacillus cuniculi]|uniref:Uncharacterized protein n=1 Tax=Mangrovibacillus cuniculi TaxID=2593652 RepID=A0A7S8CDA3_9BACI|nr:hypothetical protein [Mangrovibacillus cuniculi]QPC47853.1 hypothetical protein G8O30_13230 [Mangrovibacillus cuniculi]